MVNNKFSIIIVHHDDSDYLKLFLQSIKINSIYNNYDIIVVDNCSEKEGSINFINNLKNTNIKIIQNKENLSYIKSLEIGYKNSDGDSEFLIFSHSDNVILHQKWLDVLYDFFIKEENLGVVSAGPPVNYITQNGENINGPGYHMLCIPRKIFMNIGEFDHYFKNIGLSLYLQHKVNQIGKELKILNSINFMHHYFYNSLSYSEKKSDIFNYNNYILKETKT